MNAPDTSPRKTIRVGGGRLWWRSPGLIATATSNGALGGESAAVTYRPTTGDETTALALAWATLTPTSQPARDRIVVDEVTEAISGVAPFGDAWLYTRRDGVIPIRIARIEGTTLYLADRLKRDLTIDANAVIQSALWYADEDTAAVVGSVTRTTSGDFPIPYTIPWGVLQPANGSDGAFGIDPNVQRLEGTLSVVRQPFNTGLSSDGVRARFPELGRLSQAGSAGLEAAIYAEHEALRLRVGAAVREAGAPGYTWPDDVEAAPFVECHAAMVAARLIESVNPAQAERYAQRAAVYFEQALAIAWTDLNRDGVVDAGESPGLVGFATASQAVPSVVPARAAWWTMGERR